MDVIIGGKTVLEVAGQALVGGGVNALRDRSAQQRLSVRGLDDVQRRPATIAAGQTFYVRAEGALMVFANGSANAEWDKGSGQRKSFHEAAGRRRPGIDKPTAAPAIPQTQPRSPSSQHRTKPLPPRPLEATFPNPTAMSTS